MHLFSPKLPNPASFALSVLFFASSLLPVRVVAQTTTTAAAAAATVTNNPSVFTLNPSFVVTTATTTRTFNFVVSQATGSPDGFSRSMMVINGQFPAPLIEVNEGDTVVVNVQNNMATGTGFHWHGMLQNGTNWSDGIPGISQCPIPAGKSFQYKFTVANQFGTYWYHSHMANTMADGLQGPLVIHSTRDPLVKGVDYNLEQVIMLSDWMHDQSDVIVNDLLSGNGYRGSGAAPYPDALLFNGVGTFNCSSVTTACTATKTPSLTVLPNTKYRFRIINSGSHVLYKFSIDSHPLTVVAADAIPIKPVSGVHQLPIALAQRYDVIVNTNVGTAGSNYYARAAMCSGCIAGVPTGFQTTALAALRYTALGAPVSTVTPNSTDWSDSVNTEASFADWADSNLVPSIAKNAPTTVLNSVILSSQVGALINSAGLAVGRFFWNSVTWTNLIYQPMLFTIQKGSSLNASIITHYEFDSLGGGDIIINNLDTGIDHPYHLHGNPFWIVARGSGQLTAASYAALTFTTTNPPSRDTIVIPRSSYAVLRIITDNPGVWPLHCHIGWHLAVGKMAAIIVQPANLIKQSTPTAATALCAASNIPAGDTVDTIAPGKRYVNRAIWVEPDHLQPRRGLSIDAPAAAEEKRTNRFFRD